MTSLQLAGSPGPGVGTERKWRWGGPTRRLLQPSRWVTVVAELRHWQVGTFYQISIMDPTVPTQLLDLSAHRCQHNYLGEQCSCPCTGPHSPGHSSPTWLPPPSTVPSGATCIRWQTVWISQVRSAGLWPSPWPLPGSLCISVSGRVLAGLERWVMCTVGTGGGWVYRGISTLGKQSVPPRNTIQS